MPRKLDMLITAIAPAVWGSTYLVTTELLPAGYPITLALLRALPAGLILLLLCRRLPKGVWIGRIALLGALNFSIFWVLLFVAAYRLPGGVAATMGATQPLIVILLARLFMGSNIRIMAVLAGFAGLAGVALLVLAPITALDPPGPHSGPQTVSELCKQARCCLGRAAGGYCQALAQQPLSRLKRPFAERSEATAPQPIFEGLFKNATAWA